MNRMITRLALVSFLFAGFAATAPVQADGTATRQAQTCAKCAPNKAGKTRTAAHRSARKSASCCTSGKCCPECPTCCKNNTCNTGKCPAGCCNTAACQPGASCRE